MTSPALALQAAMKDRLLAHAPLTTLLKGAHVYDELPRGIHAPYVAFAGIETRDWSVMDQKAHEHFAVIEIATRERSRRIADAIVGEIDTVLDRAALTLADHRLINLSLLFWNVARLRNSEEFGATMRFRAATEPL